MAIFVLSDTHFGHKRVLDFERFDFKTIEEHDEFIIKKWNSVVTKKDKVYHLGDVFFGKGDFQSIIHRLNGYKILVRGNHDQKGEEYFKRIGFDEVYSVPIYLQNNIVLSHEPLKEALDNPYLINIHGHLHGSTLKLDNYFCVSMDQINYTPMNLKNIIKHANKVLKSRKEKFLKEWYAKYYNFYIDKGIQYNEDGNVDIERSLSTQYIKIDLSYDELVLLNEISEFVTRIYLGQFSHLTSVGNLFDQKMIKEIENILAEIKEKYDGLSLGTITGIYSQNAPNMAKICYDIHQKLRYQIYLSNKDRFENTVYLNNFIKASKENNVYVDRNEGKFILNVPLDLDKIIPNIIETYLYFYTWDNKSIVKIITNSSINETYLLERILQLQNYFVFKNEEYIEKIRKLLEKFNC